MFLACEYTLTDRVYLDLAEFYIKMIHTMNIKPAKWKCCMNGDIYIMHHQIIVVMMLLFLGRK